jgi:hypothetical protein
MQYFNEVALALVVETTHTSTCLQVKKNAVVQVVKK